MVVVWRVSCGLVGHGGLAGGTLAQGSEDHAGVRTGRVVVARRERQCGHAVIGDVPMGISSASIFVDIPCDATEGGRSKRGMRVVVRSGAGVQLR